MRISKWATPPGGWQFEEGNIKIKGDSFDDLVKWVRNHRLNNYKDIGDPELEIEEQIAGKFPELRLIK